MTLREIANLDCINGECELEEECFENKKMPSKPTANHPGLPDG